MRVRPKQPARDIHKLMLQFFESDAWPSAIEVDPEDGVLRTGFVGDHASFGCIAVAFEAEQQLVFHVVFADSVALHMRPKVAEFITRANYGLRIACFEMDWSDGAVRVRSGLDIEGGALTIAMIQNLTYATCGLTEHYYAALMKVLHGNLDPEAAVAEAEGG